MNSIKVLTVGVFDLLHYGHVRLFKRCKEHGNYLIVAVQDSDWILKYKPQSRIVYTTEQRVEMVSALRVVDEVILYRDVDDIVKNVEFDVFCRGEDQSHAGFMAASEWCLANGKRVVVLPRTPGVSSSALKKERVP